MKRLQFAILAGVLAAGGCSDGDGGLLGPIEGDIVAGRAAFVESCSSCHASGDGYDIAYFGFADTTIVRRAVAHVSVETARNIASYVRSLDVPYGVANGSVFQSGAGVQLADDVEFAVNLFGADQWPGNMTAQELYAMDPRKLAVAVPFPRWSSEETDTDWLPDVAFPEELLDVDHPSLAIGTPRAYLDRYYASRSTGDAVSAILTLRYALTRSTTLTGTCDESLPVFGDGATPAQRLRACFDAFRWIGSFAAQHVLRHGEDMSIPEVFHQAWWDVGNVLSQSADTALVDHAELNRAAWTYLAWTFDPGHERGGIVYRTRELAEAGFPRHATFNSLRGMVARWDNSIVRYADLESAMVHAPPSWHYNVLRFGYDYLLSLLESGVRPYDPAYPASNMRRAFSLAEPNLTDEQAAELAALRDEIVGILEG